VAGTVLAISTPVVMPILIKTAMSCSLDINPSKEAPVASLMGQTYRAMPLLVKRMRMM
jgi:hypothetical protein